MTTVNRVLLQDALAALDKLGFVGAGDPNMTGQMPPNAMPPNAMPPGGMPPGMDPSAMGPPPMDPLAMLQPMLQPMITQAVQEAMQQQQQTTAANGAAAKAKVDVATELHQMKMMMGKLMDVLGVPLSASDMFASPAPPPVAAAPPSAAPADAGGGGLGRISPIKAAEYEYGHVFEPATFQQENAETFYSTAERARAILMKSHNV